MIDTPALSCTLSLRHKFCRAMLTGLLFSLAMSALLVSSGCGDNRDVIFSTEPAVNTAGDREAMLADIASLAKGKNRKNPDNEQAYNRALDALIARGSRIEPSLIEALGGSDDWAVRLGVVNVFKAIGTRRSVEPLMGALEDAQPLVALSVNNLLSAMTKHTVIPAAGEPPRDGLVAVPQRSETDLALDAEEKIWSTWHGQYHVALHAAWSAWWEANKDKVEIN